VEPSGEDVSDGQPFDAEVIGKPQSASADAWELLGGAPTSIGATMAAGFLTSVTT